MKGRLFYLTEDLFAENPCLRIEKRKSAETA
jgi:hypothetical protein